MTFRASIGRLMTPLERGVGAWYDQERNGRATQLFLLLFVLAWTAFHIIANASIDLHFDLLETYAWSRHPRAGYYKHPPLVGLVPGAWFSVFPATDWSFHLLAMSNAALALLFIDLIARRHLTGDKRLVALLLLLFFPFYQFHAQRFSTNQLLLSTWPIATYCFLRAFETRALLWSAAAGATAALAMLAKYYSIYLILAFVVAALAHPARAAYLKSPSPWISAAVGLVVLAPHLHWLTRVEFGPFQYAYLVHGSTSMAALIGKAGNYLLGAIGYAVIPLLVYVLAVRPDRRALADALWPADANRRMLVVLLATMLFAPPLTAPLIGMQLSSLWTMSAWFLLPIVLLAPNTATLPRRRAVDVALAVTAFTAAALVAAPAVAWARHDKGERDGRAYYRLAGEQLAQAWRRTTVQPLRIVLGTFDLSVAMTFYHPDHPDSVPDFNLRMAPWITAERMAREGYAVICPSEGAVCITNLDERQKSNASARRMEIEVARGYLGRAGKSARFVLLLVAPQPATAGGSLSAGIVP